MPTLNWIGKDKVVSHHQDVPYRVLEHKYGFTSDPSTGSGKEQSEPTESGNKIIHGDNLEALKSLLPQYEGKIKCIYIDPPYNTGNESWVYNDNVNHPKIKKWLGEVVGKDGEDLTRHDKWLCMMYPRLQLLHKLLADDGAIFISIDDNEQANLKLMCDEILGQKKFVGTIGWESKTKSQNTKTSYNKLQPKVEYILCYAKQKNKRFNLIKIGKKDYPENDKNGEYRTHKIEEMSSEGVRGRDTMIFPILGINPGKDKQWKLGVDTINMYEMRDDLFLSNNKPHIKIRPSDERTSFTEPFWGYFSKEIGTGESAKTELNKIFYPDKHGFETVKPKKLIERLIYHESLKDSIILDSFAGSGTTAHAVLNLNKQDGGNRKFILIEMEDYANEITAERVKRVTKGYGKDKKAVEGTGGEFDYYELGQALFDDNQNLNEAIGLFKIQEYIWFSETRSNFIKNKDAEDYFLGKKEQAVYYFIYEKDSLTTLDFDALELIKTKGEQYIIYADNCLLPKEFMTKNNIIFKKIPRDITKF